MFRVKPSTQDPAVTLVYNGRMDMFALYARGEDLTRLDIIKPIRGSLDPDHWYLVYRNPKAATRHFETLEELSAFLNRRYS